MQAPSRASRIQANGGPAVPGRFTTDTVVSVPVETEPTFTFGSAQALFSAADYAVEIYWNPPFDVTADGQRFLMLEPVAGARETQLVVVQGFFAVLDERVGE